MKKVLLGIASAASIMALNATTATAHGTYHSADCTWVAGYNQLAAAPAAVSPGRQFATTSLPPYTVDVKIWGQWADESQGRIDGAGTYWGESDVEVNHGTMRGFLGRPGHGQDNGPANSYVLVALGQVVADVDMPNVPPNELAAEDIDVRGLCVIYRDDHG